MFVDTTKIDLRFDCEWRASRSSIWKVYILLPLLLFLTSCHRAPSIADLMPVLTAERWAMELGSGALSERYIYTFNSNGTYKASVFSDYGARPIRGTWQITNVQNEIHLLLKNEEAYYFCLWRDSILEYDEQRDVLIITGPHYTNETSLDHVKAKPVSMSNSEQVMKKPFFPPRARFTPPESDSAIQ